MRSPFAVALDDLTLDEIRSFLADVDEEGLTWEAKGDGPVGSDAGGLTTRALRKAVCGFANQVGGHVILGAAKEDDCWSLTGIAARDDEPGLWIDKALTGLQPAPSYSRRVFELEQGRWVAVVEVEPLTQTPCMTLDGQVFERVSSETVKVTDPARMATLIRRGELARANAEALTARTVSSLLGNQLGVRIVLGLAAASYEPDIGSRLFHERFRRALDLAFEERLFRETGSPRRAPGTGHHAIRQSYIQRRQSSGDIQWLVRPTWDGAVGVVASLSGDVLKVGSLFDLVLLPAWRLAGDLVAGVGGYGDAHLRISLQVQAVASRLGPFYRGLPRLTEVTRWTEVADPSDDLIGSIQRELQRAAGLWSFEGEPELPG